MTYSLAFYVAWLNAAVGVVAGVLAAAYLTVHPTWLTGDVAATAGIIVPVSVGLAALLPQVTRTPQAREDNYLKATVGALPADIAKKYPTVVPKGLLDTLP